MTIFGIVSDLCLWMRMPLLLTEKSTLRELYMFTGYVVVETVATTFNLLSFRRKSWVFDILAGANMVVGAWFFVLLMRSMSKRFKNSL